MKTKFLLALFALLLIATPARSDITFTPTTVVATSSGSVPAGKQHVEFILSSDFVGTINGAAIGNWVGVYSPGEAAPRGSFASIPYTITAGSLVITYW